MSSEPLSDFITAPDAHGYLDRKVRELRLIASALRSRIDLSAVSRPSDIVDLKFRLAAQCKADAMVSNWHSTETRWSGASCRSGPFRFGYDYQRADLKVQGPDDYELLRCHPHQHTIYTSAGMAAMTAVLVGAARVLGPCSVEATPNCYPETRELADLLGMSDAAQCKVRVIDTTIDSVAALEARARDVSLFVIDTSCVARTSGRLRALVSRLAATGVPVALVRSHMKLDSLGVEYGRLGSIVFLERGPLSEAAETAVRLTGTAPVPNHFASFAQGAEFRTLTRLRVAAMIRNGREIARALRDVRNSTLLTFPHGLYLALLVPAADSEDAARSLARSLARTIADAGLPARHAGSFGFDFFGCEWFRQTSSGRFGVRISMCDAPQALAADVAAIVREWLVRLDRAIPPIPFPGPLLGDGRRA
ncbi:MAG: hypothetical protein U1E46_14945 [Hyphomicrobiales bacterium]